MSKAYDFRSQHAQPWRIWLAVGVLLTSGCGSDPEEPEASSKRQDRETDGGASPRDGGVEEQEEQEEQVAIDVEQLLSDRCGGCHNATSNTSGLDLDSPGVADRVSGASSTGCEGYVLADPQDPTGSLLYLKVGEEDTGCGDVMPPPPIAALTEAERLALRDWVAGLAPPTSTSTCEPRSVEVCEDVGNPSWWPDLSVSKELLEAEMSKICSQPVRTCSADGSEWGPCVGILPGVEDCTTEADEDCNLTTPAKRCQSVAWNISVAGDKTQRFDSVDTDGDGNVYVLGTFEGTTNFGGGEISSDSPGGQFKNNVFLGKYDKNGTFVWGKNIGDSSNQYAAQVAVDADSGDVALSLRLFGSADFGPGTPKHTQRGNCDLLVALFNANGEHQWSQRLGGGAVDRAERLSFSRDNGDVLLAGKAGAHDSVVLEVPGKGNLEPKGQADGLVVRFGRTVGDIKWATLLGGPQFVVGDTELEGIGESCDAGDGEEYRRCRGCGAQHCVPNSPGSAMGSWGNECQVVTAQDKPLFGCQQADLLCSEEQATLALCMSGDDDYAYGVDTDADGNVLVTGRFEGYFDFEALNGAAEQLASRGRHDIFVASLDAATGEPRWQRHFGGSGEDRSYDLRLQEGSNQAIVVGYFTGEVEFGNADGELALSAQGGAEDDDFLVLALDAESGETTWAQAYGSDVSQFGWGHTLGESTRTLNLDIDASDNLYVGGSLYGSWDGKLSAKRGENPRPDLFFVQLSPSGTYANGRVHGGTGSELGYDLAVDPATDSILLVGRSYAGRIDLGAAGKALGLANTSTAFAAKWPLP